MSEPVDRTKSRDPKKVRSPGSATPTRRAPIGPVDRTKPHTLIKVRSPCVIMPLRRAPLDIGIYEVQGDVRSKLRAVRERRMMAAGIFSLKYIDNETVSTRTKFKPAAAVESGEIADPNGHTSKQEPSAASDQSEPAELRGNVKVHRLPETPVSNGNTKTYTHKGVTFRVINGSIEATKGSILVSVNNEEAKNTALTASKLAARVSESEAADTTPAPADSDDSNDVVVIEDQLDTVASDYTQTF